MKPSAYASDLHEFRAIVREVIAEREEVVQEGEVSAKYLRRRLLRAIFLGLKMMLGIDRGGKRLPFESPMPDPGLIYLLRIALLLLVFVAILTIAAIPLLFIDLQAAAVILLLDLSLLGGITLICALYLWWSGRSPGSGPHRRRFLLDLTGALGRLTTGLR